MGETSYGTLAIHVAKKAAKADTFIGSPAPEKVWKWKTDLIDLFVCNVSDDDLASLQTTFYHTTEKVEKRMKELCDNLIDTLIPKLKESAKIDFEDKYSEWARSKKIDKKLAKSFKNDMPIMRRIQGKSCSQFCNAVDKMVANMRTYQEAKSANPGSVLTTNEQDMKIQELNTNEIHLLDILKVFTSNQNLFGLYAIGKTKVDLKAFRE